MINQLAPSDPFPTDFCTFSYQAKYTGQRLLDKILLFDAVKINRKPFYEDIGCGVGYSALVNFYFGSEQKKGVISIYPYGHNCTV